MRSQVTLYNLNNNMSISDCKLLYKKFLKLPIVSACMFKCAVNTSDSKTSYVILSVTFSKYERYEMVKLTNFSGAINASVGLIFTLS